jgi:HPt (histidine-containing phosphotransfer) domain-containing protein
MAPLLRSNPDFKPVYPTLGQKQPEQSQVNLKYLREMANGDAHFIQEIISMFIQQAPVNAEKLLKLTKEENWPELKALAHKMKSSVALIGNQELEIICQDIQQYALLPNQNGLIPGLVLRAKTICEKAVAELKQELKTIK